MHKKEAKYVVNLTNKNIALDGRFVEKFSILYLGAKEIKQWGTIYSTLLRKGKIKLARTHEEATDILKNNLPTNLIPQALKRNENIKDKDNIHRVVEYNDTIKRYTIDSTDTTTPGNVITPEVNKEVEHEEAPSEVITAENISAVKAPDDTQVEELKPEFTEAVVTDEEVAKSIESSDLNITPVEPTTKGSDSFELAGEEPKIEESSDKPTLADLKAMAKAKGIKGYTKMTETELEEALSK